MSPLQHDVEIGSLAILTNDSRLSKWCPSSYVQHQIELIDLVSSSTCFPKTSLDYLQLSILSLHISHTTERMHSILPPVNCSRQALFTYKKGWIWCLQCRVCQKIGKCRTKCKNICSLRIYPIHIWNPAKTRCNVQIQPPTWKQL